MSDGRRVSLSKKQLEDGIGAELFSLCHAITADGRLSKEEIRALDRWLRDNKDVPLPGIAFLTETLGRIVADGIVTLDDQRELLEAIEKVLPVESRKSAKAARKQVEKEREAVREQQEQEELCREFAEAERRAPIDDFDFMVAGVQFEGRDRIISRYLNVGDRVRIALQPDNQYDDCAVGIHLVGGQQIGFVPRTESADVTTCVKGSAFYIATVKKILQGSRAPIPVIVLQFFEENQYGHISEFNPDSCRGAESRSPLNQNRKPWWKFW
jgi:hypothetical protein